MANIDISVPSAELEKCREELISFLLEVEENVVTRGIPLHLAVPNIFKKNGGVWRNVLDHAYQIGIGTFGATDSQT